MGHDLGDLHALGSLTCLQHLEVQSTDFDTRHLQPLSSLVSLRHCSLGPQETACPLNLQDVSALFTLPHLTTLELWGVQHSSTTWDPELTAACHRAVAPLSRLQHLETLAFGPEFDVDDSVFAVLTELRQLRSLSVGCITLSAPTAGHLPLLQQLRVRTLTPTQLLQTLLPLQPLASLTSWGNGALELFLGCSSHAVAATEAVDLRQVAEMLAKSPVQLQDLHFYINTAGGVRWSAKALIDSLSPLDTKLKRSMQQLRHAWGPRRSYVGLCVMAGFGLHAGVALILGCIRMMKRRGVRGRRQGMRDGYTFQETSSEWS